MEIFKQGNGIIKQELKEDQSYEWWIEWTQGGVGGGGKDGKTKSNNCYFPSKKMCGP